MTLALVTGGSGFVGRHVVAALREAGTTVRVLDLVPPATEHPPAVELVLGDVRSPAACEAALDGVDVVLHQAAKVGLGVDVADLPAYADVNATGTAVLLAAMAARGVDSLVLASSMVVYGEGAYACPSHGPAAPPPRAVTDLDAGRFEPPCPTCGGPLAPGLVGEDAALDPRNAYAASKVAQEHLAAAWARATGGRAVALRYHNVYGPGLPRDTPYAGVAAIFCSALARGQAPRVFEDGGQRRDFVHVRDVAGANVAAADLLAGHADAGPEGTRPRDRLPAGTLQAYNVGSGTPRTIGEMAAALAASVGGPAPRVVGGYRLGDVRHVTASSERAAAELGWRATEPFGRGMAELAAELVGPVDGAGGGGGGAAEAATRA